MHIVLFRQECRRQQQSYVRLAQWRVATTDHPDGGPEDTHSLTATQWLLHVAFCAVLLATRNALIFLSAPNCGLLTALDVNLHTL